MLKTFTTFLCDLTVCLLYSCIYMCTLIMDMAFNLCTQVPIGQSTIISIGGRYIQYVHYAIDIYPPLTINIKIDPWDLSCLG